MLLNKQLLLVIDQQDREFRSLYRAQLIAGRLQCPVSLLWLGDDAGKAEQLARQLRQDGIRVDWQLCKPDKLLSKLEQLWQEQHFGLLIKSCDTGRKGFMTSRDGQILRELPCPVLLVNSDQLWQDSVIMAAVDPLAPGSEQQLMNRELLSVAAEIARVTDARLAAAVACPSAMMGAEAGMQSEELIQSRAAAAANSLLGKLNIERGELAVGEGPAEYWIPAAAKQLQAHLVVIGTKARGGIRGALIGNTAERILQRLDADILVMRTGVSDEVVPILKQ